MSDSCPVRYRKNYALSKMEKICKNVPKQNSIRTHLKRGAIPVQEIHLRNFMLVLQTHLFSKV